jgi:hypothetical protein
MNMQRSLGMAAALALMLAPLPARAQGEPKVDLTGKWAFLVTYDGGSGSPMVTLTQKGDSLTGIYSSQAFGEQAIAGVVSGREFSFAFTAATGGETFTMTFLGTIAGPDALQGSVDMGGMGTASFTAKRQKPSGPPDGSGEGLR